MQSVLERLIKIVYRKWKSAQPKITEPHPDEETLVCFIEARLPVEESKRVRAHLVSCDSCADALAIQARLAASLRATATATAGLKLTEEKEVPEELIERVKNLVIHKDKLSILEIMLRLKEKTLEIMNTTGDVLVGQELMPAPVLRSRRIKDFKDEVTILKDFKDIRVEVKIENKHGQAFNLTVMAKEKETQNLIKDLRVTLLKDDLELESYLTDYGKVTFEHVLLGKYTVEVSSFENKLASILLDIKI